MTKLQYLDKRDEAGVLLGYSARELAYEMTCKALDLIRDTELFSIMTCNFPRKYIDLYYQKMLIESLSPIANQLVINKHDKYHFGNPTVNNINANSFPCYALLREIWNDGYVDFSFSTDPPDYLNKTKIKPHEIVKYFLKKVSRSFTMFPAQGNMHGGLNRTDSKSSRIAVKYNEGFDPQKRSDTFWLKNSGINPESVIIYYDNPQSMVRMDKETTAQQYYAQNGYNQLKIWEWKASTKIHNYETVINQLKSSKKLNDIEKWFYNTAIHFCEKVSFWSNIFDEQNIKIHLDSTESGLETIVKQIALYNLGGLSLGKLRSYPIVASGQFVGYYPNDVFFSWGYDSGRKIHENNSHIPNIIISGLPSASIQMGLNQKRKSKITFENPINSKFNLLLIDSNHGQNKGLEQFIPSTEMTRFYQVILNWVREDEDLGLVIKPKKSHLLHNLPKIENQIIELEEQTKRVVLIKDAFQKKPASYLSGIDVVIGTSIFYPAAIIECVINGARAVFYDYPNLRYHEPDIYQWGENKVMFTALDVLIGAVKAYKNDPSSNSLLGDWSEHLDELDPFRDNRGGERIGTYMHWLQEGFNEGLDRNGAIDLANKLYAEAWGEDKVNLSDKIKTQKHTIKT